MAEYVAIYAIQSLLSEVLKFNVQNLPELRGRIELIQLNLRKLQSILEIADARQEVDEGIRKWVAETREVAYEIEDLLLETSLFRKEGNILKKYSLFKDVRLEPKITLVERKISALESDLRVRNILPRQVAMPNPIPQRLQQRRRTYSHLNEEDFVGFEEDVEELVTRLVEEDGDRESQVVSITGMGGIGKTTLAKKIYHHKDVRSHFQAFAWICISQQWQLDDVLQGILNKLEPEKRKEIKEMKVGELVKELFDVQQWKRCFIVLDDVWDKDVWDILKPAFPTRQNSSKVLITTRNREIALHINTYAACYLYEQRHLNENESWELLKKKIYHRLTIAGEHDEYLYGGEDDDGASSTESFHSCRTDEEEDEAIDNLDSSSSEDSIRELQNYMDMEKLGKEMVGHCAGLPLAISVLGGVLTTKSTINEWRTVHQNFYSYSRKGRNSRENARVHEVLALSYHDLPYQIKPCFLYLGNFPEDFKIPTQKLYRLWAAEGFISSESDQGEEEEDSIMDMGERYLVELVQRCMVQVQVDELTGKFKSCQLHDFTRELCLLKGKEENFLKKVPFRHETNLLSSPSPSAKVTSISVTRRLSIAVENDFESYFPTANLEHIRSALFFSRLSDRKNLQPTLNLLCNKSKLLRVLGLERFDLGEKLSKDIGNLVHLRYLSLKGSQFYKLPSSIGDLKYLQTLDLRVPFLVALSIPNVIWRLNQLRHLYLPPTHRCKDKLQLSGLSKLEILKNFDTRVSDYKDILKLTKLQKLTAVLDLQTENLEAIIAYLGTERNPIRDSSFRIHHVFKFERDLFLLRKLAGHIHLRKLDLIGLIDRLPEHSFFGQSLIKLTLRNSMLKEDPMATLEKLPSLRSLILRKNVFEKNEIRCSSEGFPQLRFLELQGLNSLENWRIEEGTMPKLHFLKIDECINLKMVPEGIIFIASLRALVIANMPDAFKNRVQKVQDGRGEDYNKIKRIPSVKIIQTSTDYMKQLERLPSGTTKFYAELLRSFTPTLIPKEWENS